MLSETSFESVSRKVLVNISFAASTVTCVDPDNFTKQLVAVSKLLPEHSKALKPYLLYHRNERRPAWKFQFGERNVSGC